MSDLDTMNLPVFSLFAKEWALVTAGSMARHNGCTIGWGGMGTLWTRPGSGGAVITVYVRPGRYTLELLKQNAFFTVCFFPPEYKKALGYMGAHSGRDGDKAAAAGLTPVPVGESVGYAEADLTFLCRKLYQHPFFREDLAPEIRDYYRANPKVYPPDENGEWQPHWVFVGEITRVDDRRGGEAAAVAVRGKEDRE